MLPTLILCLPYRQGRQFLFRYVFILSLVFVTGALHAQEEKRNGPGISINVTAMPLDQVLKLVEKQAGCRFAYNTELVQKQRAVTLSVNSKSLQELLDILLHDTGISYTILGNQVVLEEGIKSNKVSVSGYVKDVRNGEFLIGASIYIPSLHSGTVSNNYGFFSFTINTRDTLDILISYISYQTQLVRLRGVDMFLANIGLRSVADSIANVSIVYDKAEDNVKRNLPASVDLAPDVMNTVFSVNGKGDIVNSLQMLPGVQVGLDNNPGYFVRGGNADQNLILLDEATVYNPNHLLNVASIFNSSVIKNAALLKGGFPASYGDHLSSVLDVSMKDGSNQAFNGSLELGTIASSLLLSGPLKTNKASFIVAARRSTFDLLLRPFHVQKYYSEYHFYDFNAKLNYQVSKKDRFFLSGYYGSDESLYSTDADSGNNNNNNNTDSVRYGINFGNRTLTVRWNHLFSKKIFSNTSFVYNKYHLSLSAQQKKYYAELYSGIRDMNIKTDITCYPGLNNKISGGINYLHQTVYPASVSNKIQSTGSPPEIIPSDIPEKMANRIAVYLADEIKKGKTRWYGGVRIPVYFKPGIQYVDAEPRLSFLYLVSPTSSIKLSYSEMHQYLHLVRSFNASFPAELWIGSSNKVKPESSRQVSVGLFKNLYSNMFQVSAEAYYKTMENQLLFRGTGSTALQEDIEEKLVFGRGWSYGAEFFLRKSKGRLTGWAGYAFSCAYQQFDSLNFGLKFIPAQNRKHSASASLCYDISPSWTISGQFLAATGSNLTLNTDNSSGNQDYNPLFDEGDNNGNNGNNGSTQSIEPNNYSLIPYNRLDISIRHKKTRKASKRSIETEWAFSVYNVYARHNTYFVYRTINPQTNLPEVKEVSFVPVIPSVTYSLKF